MSLSLINLQRFGVVVTVDNLQQIDSQIIVWTGEILLNLLAPVSR